MSNNEPKSNSGQPEVYQIRLKGHLDCPWWADWFGGLTIMLEGNGNTLLTGPLDQAALHGLFKKVRDLGMPLLSINQVEPGPADVPVSPPGTIQ